MHHKLHFLDWHLTLADAVGAYLLDGLDGKPLNLSDTALIVPTVQSGRRVRRALADRAALKDAGLLTGPVMTPFRLLETPGKLSRFALSAFWIDALSPAVCRKFQTLFPRLPGELDFEWRKKTAGLFIQLREELAEAGLRVSDVAGHDAVHEGEKKRWHDIAELTSVVNASIEKAGFRDPVEQQLAAAHDSNPPEGIKRVVLAACPEVAPVIRTLLERWSRNIPVDVLVHAPPSLADAFDAWGCPLPDRWLNDRELSFDASVDLVAAANEREQAEAVRRVLESHPGAVKEGAIAIGMPDPSVTPFMVQTLSDLGCPSYDPNGVPHACHPVYLWIKAWRDLSSGGRYESLRTFVRHADVLEYVKSSQGVEPALLLQEVDEVQNQRIPETFGDVRDYVADRRDRYPRLSKVMEWLAGLLDQGAENDPAHIRHLLAVIYEGRDLKPGRPEDDAFIEVARELVDTLDEHASIMSRFPGLRVSDWLDLLLHAADGSAYYLDVKQNAIDLEGWLELIWNDASLMAVTGMNDTVVPGGTYEDLFLPDSVREQLGVRGSMARTARDAYLLYALSRVRKTDGSLTLIAGRHNESGDVLKPSRLFWLCADDEMIKRASLFFGAANPLQSVPERTFNVKLNLDPPDDRARSRIARKTWAVTEFRGYLTCPLRFYLENVLEMGTLSDDVEELDALDFGTLVHNALEAFGHDRKLWACGKPEIIGQAFDDLIDTAIRQRFGRNPPMMVRIQGDAAVQRLKAYAYVHVEDFQEGWQIEDVERRFTLNLDGVEVVGKIDRIDRHPDGRIRVLDYKTYNKPADPVKAHLRAPRDVDTRDYVMVGASSSRATKNAKLIPRHWADLQLPLYLKHMLETEGEDAPVATGYVLLTKAATDVSIALWDGLDRRLVRSAVACARGVIRDTSSGIFGPPLVETVNDDFAELLWPDFIHDLTDMEGGRINA